MKRKRISQRILCQSLWSLKPTKKSINSESKPALRIYSLLAILRSNKSQRKIYDNERILQITGYDTEFIQIDSFEYPPAVILTPNQILNWEVESPETIKIENFAILKCLAPIPEYVLIGVPDASVIKQSLKD